MDWTWALRGLVGGALIGAAASLLLVLNGRIAGISGIVGGLIGDARTSDWRWRALFVLGLVGVGALALLVMPSAVSGTPPALGIATLAGLLVGVGTKLGNGCTSGHGVCGISRFSVRSIVATVTVITTGAVAVLLARGLS